MKRREEQRDNSLATVVTESRFVLHLARRVALTNQLKHIRAYLVTDKMIGKDIHVTKSIGHRR